MASFVNFGNDLYTGKRSVNFVGNRRVWFSIAALLVIASILVPIFKGGFNFGIEFTGGSQFTISDAHTTDQDLATKAVAEVVPDAVARVVIVGGSGVRVQTDQLTPDQTQKVTQNLATAYGVDEADVTTNFVGATWGNDVTKQSLTGLVIFLVLTFIIMGLYFRTWKMSAAAIITLFDVLIITLGIYSASGFEITPAAVIGFLTILGYSLYDTVVVFDKIRRTRTRTLRTRREPSPSPSTSR